MYRNIKPLELERNKDCGSTYIRSAAGELLLDKHAILQHWKEWFRMRLNAISLTLDPSGIDIIE